MNDIERFSFFKSYFETIERFKYEESKAEFVLAILYFIYYDKEPAFSKREKDLKEMAWISVVATLKSSKARAKNAKKKSEENQN